MKKLNRKEWIGERVRGLESFSNKQATLPIGTIYTVKKKLGRFLYIESDPCPHCNARHMVHKVRLYQVEVIEVEA